MRFTDVQHIENLCQLLGGVKAINFYVHEKKKICTKRFIKTYNVTEKQD